MEIRQNRVRNQISQLELTLEGQLDEDAYRESIQRSLLNVMAQKCRLLDSSNAISGPKKEINGSSKTESISYLFVRDSQEEHQASKKPKTIDRAQISSWGEEDSKEETIVANEIPFHSSTTEELLQILSKESSESENDNSYPSLILSPPDPPSPPVPSLKTPDTIPQRSHKSDDDHCEVEKKHSKRSKCTESRPLPKKRKISHKFEKDKSEQLLKDKIVNMYQTPMKKKISKRCASSAAKRREFHALFKEMVGDRTACEVGDKSEQHKAHLGNEMDVRELNGVSHNSASEDFEKPKPPQLFDKQRRKRLSKTHSKMPASEQSQETDCSSDFQIEKSSRKVNKSRPKKEKPMTAKARKKTLPGRKQIDANSSPIFKPNEEKYSIDEVERSAISRFNSGLLGRTRKQPVPLSRPPKVAITPGRSSISSVMAQRISFRSSDTDASAPKFSFFDAFMNNSKPVIPRLKATSLSRRE